MKRRRQLIDERIGSGIEGIPTSSSIGDDNADDDNAVSFNNSQVYDNDALNEDHNDIDIEPTQPLPALPSTLLQSAQSNVSAVFTTVRSNCYFYYYYYYSYRYYSTEYTIAGIYIIIT